MPPGNAFVPRRALDEDGVAELVVAVAVLGELRANPVEQRVVGERAKQFEVAFARPVHTSDDRVHDAKPGAGADAAASDTGAGMDEAAGVGGEFRARTTVVPTAMMRRPFSLAMPMAAVVRLGMR